MKMRITKATRSVMASVFLFLAGCGEKAEPGEDVVKKEDRNASIVTLTQASLENMDLETEPAKMGTLDLKLTVPGRIAADGNRTAKVSANLEGRIVRLDGDAGDKVAQGAILGILESPELLDKALALKAPISGVIMEKTAAVGERVEKGGSIYTLSDTRFLWLIGEVKERDIASVRPGQAVDFSVPAYPGEVFRGKVARMGNVVEPGSRTFEIRVEMGNPGGKLKPGMFAEIRITTEVLRDALLVPDAAIQSEGEARFLFVALDAGRFEKRMVKAGREQDGMVRILEGLAAGETVVTEGGFTLKSELLKGELGEE
ncbi:MAG TPA: efflux RND transporter periplasmic adaptor subunit [Fibrobacteria bacterium]|nr:efflux RND transporter periplasmic adaptor subunit [Fibrobacteria bacterium]